ncbi:TolB-like translocation protein [Spartinivicinus ruber]|uniref:hypothetical protein n=1 Tax=Spartinivicinus ruber TaxID=2683272 RepID=UPI0013D32EC0|nr:hypothetical protein [Spartinivicinus ruber]
MKKQLSIFFLSLFIIAGCSEEQSSSSKETSQQEQKITLTQADLLGLKLEEEVWQDPKSYDSPRIQFVWDDSPSGLETKHQMEIWSAKPDFSDLKIRVPGNLIKGIVRDSKPSPDGRYVAMAVDDGERYEKQLYDIKAKQLKVMSFGPVIPSFEWSQDSKTVYFNEAGNMKKYHVPTNKLEVVTKYEEHGNSFILMDKDTKFVFTRNKKIIIRDVETGKKMYEKEYGSVDHRGLIKYKNGKVFGYQTNEGFIVANIDSPEKELIKLDGSVGNLLGFDLKSYNKIWLNFFGFIDFSVGRIQDVENISKFSKAGGSKNQYEFYNL